MKVCYTMNFDIIYQSKCKINVLFESFVVAYHLSNDAMLPSSMRL